MGKPFKIDGSGPARDITGRFARPETPSPTEIAKRAESTGSTVFEVGNENKAPEHVTPKGSPKSGEEIPWPAAGPTNDANKKPFKLSGG